MIYFLEQEDSQYVKIGYTSSKRTLKTRMETIQCGSPHVIHLIGVIEGGRKEEMALHARFSEARFGGEWFLKSEDIEQYLENERVVPVDLSKIETSGGIRKLIYVKSQDVWDEIEAAAEKIDRSVSWYLLDCHRRCKEIDDEIARAVSRGEIVSVDPEVEKTVPKKSGKKAALAKIKETGFFNPQLKNKDKK